MSKAQPIVTFWDKAYKSRVLITPEDRTLVVDNHQVITSEPAEIAYLDKHADFERQKEA